MNNAEKLKLGVNEERKTLTDKNFSINAIENVEKDKFNKANEFFNVKAVKPKLITLTIKVTEDEWDTISAIIKLLVKNDFVNVKQTEIIRMGVKALSNLTEIEQEEVYRQLIKFKPGR